MRAAVRVSLKCLVLLAVSALLWSCKEPRGNGDWTITAVVDQASSAPANTSSTPPLPVDSRIEVRCTLDYNFWGSLWITNLGMTVAQIECTNISSNSGQYLGDEERVEFWVAGTTSYYTHFAIDGVFAHDQFAPGRFTAKIYDVSGGVLLGESQGIFAMNKR